MNWEIAGVLGHAAAETPARCAAMAVRGAQVWVSVVYEVPGSSPDGAHRAVVSAVRAPGARWAGSERRCTGGGLGGGCEASSYGGRATGICRTPCDRQNSRSHRVSEGVSGPFVELCRTLSHTPKHVLTCDDTAFVADSGRVESTFSHSGSKRGGAVMAAQALKPSRGAPVPPPEGFQQTSRV